MTSTDFSGSPDAAVWGLPEHRVLPHAGRGPPGPEGAGGPGHPAEDAPAARGTQLGEAELWKFARWEEFVVAVGFFFFFWTVTLFTHQDIVVMSCSVSTSTHSAERPGPFVRHAEAAEPPPAARVQPEGNVLGEWEDLVSVWVSSSMREWWSEQVPSTQSKTEWPIASSAEWGSESCGYVHRHGRSLLFDHFCDIHRCLPWSFCS